MRYRSFNDDYFFIWINLSYNFVDVGLRMREYFIENTMKSLNRIFKISALNIDSLLLGTPYESPAPRFITNMLCWFLSCT